MKKDIILKIREHAIKNGNHCALLNPYSIPTKMTYKELFCKAVILANYLNSIIKDNNPIVVYGHKNPYMVVSFLACVMSGHAYCPIDVSVPNERINMILDQTQSNIILATENFSIEKVKCLNLQQIENIVSNKLEEIPKIPETLLTLDETFYIIFTSGSTGIPKGVEITYAALNNFLEWSSTLGEEATYNTKTVFLNQAPFSFDLSVMDLYTALYCGASLCMMEKQIQSNLIDIVPFIKTYNITAFVSTPSFVNMCLVDKNFNSQNIPSLNSFFFCGEVLTNKTVIKLMKRFPEAIIQNTYGPTESTVAVSNIRINKQISEKFSPLPVGYAKPGTFFIIDGDGNKDEKGHEIGEILIAGNTLAKGYFKRKDLTKKAFMEIKYKGKQIRAYRTGDSGYIENGLLFYNGRLDLQIKLNGYRIELGDIESCLLKQDNIDACVVVPRVYNNQIKSLVAMIVLNQSVDKNQEENIKAELSKFIPHYMIPQNYIFVNSLPMTTNGKIDRKKISLIMEEE